MKTPGLRFVLLIVFIATVAAVLIERQIRLDRLRDEATRVRPAEGLLVSLNAENARLEAGRTPDAQLESLRTDHANIARLRNEVAAVQRSLDARTQPEDLREQASSRPYPTLLDHELSREQWRNAGRDTPAATVETMLWAAAGGDVEHIGDTLALTTEAREKANALLASLPADIREGYANAENFIAMLTAKQAPMGSAAVVAEVPYPEGTILVTNFKDFYGNAHVVALALRTDGNGWRIDVPPSAIERYASVIRADPRSLRLDSLSVR